VTRTGEAAGVGGVEHRHHLVVDVAQLEGVPQQRIGFGRARTEEGQAAFDARIGVVGAVAQRMGVVCIGAYTLEAVEVEVAQADDIGAQDVQIGVHPDLRGLRHYLGDLLGGHELRCAGEGFGLNAGGSGSGLVGGLGLVARLDGLGDQRHEPGRVEVDVGQRGEQVEGGARSEARIGNTEFAQLLRVLPDPQIDLNQHVLQRRRRGVLAAVSLGGRAPERQQIGTIGRLGAIGLLALVTKHGVLLTRRYSTDVLTL
jgi:hypothetical protein